MVSTLTGINDDEIRKLLSKHAHLKKALARAIARETGDAPSDSEDFQPDKQASGSGEHTYLYYLLANIYPKLEDEESDGNITTSKPKGTRGGRKRQRKKDSASRFCYPNSFSNSFHRL